MDGEENPMSKRLAGRAMIFSATLLAAAALAADDIPLSKDLTAVIALQGLPCGHVVKVKQQGDNDYIASCRGGNRYHVFVNPAGRVVAQKQ
jgi:hypothetical protein